jgi:hypothetical protein
MFFFEKKNQKTFNILGVACEQQDVKVFCFAQGGLRLFSKKKALL